MTRTNRTSLRFIMRSYLGLAGAGIVLLAGVAQAQYTWTGNASTGNWNNKTNWGGAGYPSQPTDIANFSAATPQQPAFTTGAQFGTLNVTGSTNWTWTGTFTVTNNSAINYGSSSTNVSSFSSTTLLAGTGGVTVTSGYLSLLDVNNTYSGPTWVQGGILDVTASSLSLGSASSAGNSTADVLLGGGPSNATLRCFASGTSTRGITVTNVINGVTNGTGQYTLYSPASANTICGGTLTLGTNLFVTAPKETGTGSAGPALGLNSLIQGPGGITIVGPGEVSIARTNTPASALTNNTFTGPVAIQSGILYLASAGSGVLITTNVPCQLGMPGGGPNSVVTLGTPGSTNLCELFPGYSGTWNRPITVIGLATIYCGDNAATWSFLQPFVLSNSLTLSSGTMNITNNATITAMANGTIAPTVTVSAATVNYFLTNAPTLSTLITGGGTIKWQYLNAASGTPIGWGPGFITLDNGSFTLALSTPGANLTLTNAVIVTTNGGSFYFTIGTGAITNIATGPITLGGQLSLAKGNTAQAGSLDLYQNPISISQSNGFPCGISLANDAVAYQLQGTISDGAGSAGNSLCLNVAGAGHAYTTNMDTHAYGTFIEPDYQHYLDDQSTVSSLGTGDIWLPENAALRLNQSSQVAAGAKIGMWANNAAMSMLILSNNFVPTFRSDAVGLLALDYPGYSAISSELAQGNGQMFLGAFKGGTFTGSTLTPGAGNIYRLGGGGGTLTVKNGVLVGAGNAVQVGNYIESGTILLLATNTYGGGTIVNPSSVLQGQAPNPGGGSPFGSSSGSVTLNSSTLQLIGTNVTQTINVGALTANGAVVVEASQANTTATNTLAFSSALLTSTNAILLANGASSPAGLGGSTRIVITNNPPVPNNNMVNPGFLFVGSGGNDSFVTYNTNTDASGTIGFQPATNYYVPFNNTYASLTAVGSTSIANYNYAAGTNLVMTGDASVYALVVNSTRFVLANDGTYHTLNIGSGGILVNPTDYLWVSNNVNFGSARGIICGSHSSASDYSTTTFYGSLIGTNGLTVTCNPYYGRGVSLYGDSSASLTGTIACIQAGISFTNSNAFGAPGNVLYLDGGNLIITAGSVNLSRSIVLGPGGTALTSPEYQVFTFSGPITGPGPLTCTYFGASQSASVTIAGSNNTYSGGTFVGLTSGDNAGSAVVASNATLGVGDVHVQTTLNLYGNYNIGGGDIYGNNTTQRQARLSIENPGTVNFYCLAPSIGSLSGSGAITLTNNAVLTLGGDNTSTIFDGTINQSSGSGCSIVKTGTGVFSFKGVLATTGTSVASNGTLVVDGYLSGGVTVRSGAVLAGAGTVAGAVTLQSGATFIPGSTQTNSGTAGRTTGLSAGSLALVSGSTIMITISNATTYTQINAGGGAVTLGGSTLQVTMLPGYTPGPTDSFTIITNAASVSQTFTTGLQNNTAIALANGYTAKITYGANSVTLSNFTRGAGGSTLFFW